MESNYGTGGLSGQKYVIFPSSGGSGNYAGAGVSVGTNGVSVYEHADNYMPAVLVWQSPVPLTDWTHIAIVYTNGRPSLYINGVFKHTGVQSGKGTVYPGMHFPGGYTSAEGNLPDEMRIWKVTRTAAEIQADMNGEIPGSTPGLVGYWPMNEGSGGVMHDLSGNGRDISLNSSYSNSSWVAGRYSVESGNSYRYGFNGQEHSTEIDEDNDYTAEFWEYDARIGRRWNVDPVPKSMISGYAVLGNCPILMVDPLGNDWYKNKKSGDLVFNEARHGKRKGFESKGSSFMQRENGHLMWYQSTGQVAELSENSVVVRASVGARTVRHSYTYNERVENNEPLIQAGDSKTYMSDINEKSKMFERWKKAGDEYRSMQKWVFGGMAAVVALPAAGFLALETGATTYASAWVSKNGAEYAVTFGIETTKSLWANRGNFKKMDWIDIMSNTITSKMGLMGKVYGKIFNSAVDYNMNDGLRFTFGTGNYNKTISSTGADLFFNFFKLGAGEAGKAGGVGDAPRMGFDVLVDQVKATYKDLNH